MKKINLIVKDELSSMDTYQGFINKLRQYPIEFLKKNKRLRILKLCKELNKDGTVFKKK